MQSPTRYSGAKQSEEIPTIHLVKASPDFSFPSKTHPGSFPLIHIWMQYLIAPLGVEKGINIVHFVAFLVP